MFVALLLSALAMGLAGGPHCAVMCGAAHTAIARKCGHGADAPAMLALQAGRLVSYALAGALVGTGLASLAALQEAAPFLRPIWVMAHVAALAFGGWLVWSGAMPRRLAFAHPAGTSLRADFQPIRFVDRVPGPLRAGLIGGGWALVPCGLLQAALVVAALAPSPVQSATVMAAFALASAVSLLAAPALWLRLSAGDDRRFATIMVRGAGLLLAAASAFAIYHDLMEGVASAFCLTPG